MSKYGRYGQLNAQPGKGDELAAILLEAAELMGAVDGCHLYIVGKDAQNGDTIWVTEVWDSKDTHDNALKAEAVRQLIARAMPLLAGPPKGGTELNVLGGVGL